MLPCNNKECELLLLTCNANLLKIVLDRCIAIKHSYYCIIRFTKIILPMTHFQQFCVKVALLVLVLVNFTTLFAQTTAPFNNEWIDFNKTYYKIKVAKNGLHRIPFSTLTNGGVPTNNAAAFKLYSKGQEIPIYTSTNGELGDSDYIEFYAEKNDGSLDTRLYLYPAWQPNPYVSMFSDTLAYFLTINDTGSNLRFSETTNDISTAPPKEQYFMYESVRQNVNTFYSGRPIRLGGINTNYSDFEEGEGFVGPSIEVGTNANYNIVTRSVYTGSTAVADTVSFTTRILGQSNLFDLLPDHRAQIKVNGNLRIDYQFEGYSSQTVSFSVPADQLTSPNTQINVASMSTLQDGSSLLVNRNSVPFITVNYPHSFDFAALPSYKFTLKNDTPKYIEITNFTGGTAPVLYDLTHYLRFIPVVETVSGQTIYKFHLPQVASGQVNRTLFFSSTSTALPVPVVTSVNTLQTVNFTNYNLTENRGDYLILTHPNLMLGDVNQVERYREYRSSMEGGSYNVLVVNIEELYDQFSWGISKHPLSINNFTRFAMATWADTPKQLLLLGKSIVYRDSYAPSNPANFARNLVPTFGHSASDNMLSSSYPAANYRNAIPTGRIPANTPEDVAAYLNKIIEYESLQNNPSCNPQDRLWMKHALHIAGGSNLGEAEYFFNNLESYRNKFEDISFGGKVIKTYRSFSPNPVDEVDLGNYINNGVSVINFVGHGSGGYWQVNIQSPEAYQNYGKYPFIMASSCFVGDIHSYDLNSLGEVQTAMSEDYVLAENLGSIGFLATVSSGFPLYLHQFNSRLYDHYCKNNYGKSIGYSIQQTINDLYIASPNEAGPKITCQEYTLVGDPALVIKSWKNPEYIIDQSGISFTPAVITAELDSFTLSVAVTNLGEAVADSFTLQVNRLFPDGSTAIYNKRFPSTIYQDTLRITIPTGDPASVEGENQFTVSLDPNNEFTEDCKDNNITTKNIFVFSDLLIPIFPCNFAIVNTAPITLKASTGQPILPALNYILQLDTTELFNNPLAQTIINSEAGVIEWQPTFTYTENTVYYWRTALMKENPDSINWKYSSFIYLPSGQEGWNQSHYYQLRYNQTERMYLDSISRKHKFTQADNYLTASNQYSNFGGINFTLNGTPLKPISYCLQDAACLGGIVIAAFKPDLTLEPMTSQRISGSACDGRGQYGNLHCAFGDRFAFEFNTNNQEQIDSLVSFLQNHIPNGYYILAMSVNQHRLSAMTPSQNAALQSVFSGMGINNLFSVPDNEAFIAFGQKNNPEFGEAYFVYGPATVTTPLTMDKVISVRAASGVMTTPPIGPASQWSNLQYQFSNSSPSDTLRIFGVQAGVPDILLAELNAGNGSGDFNLAMNTAANNYHFLRLAFTTNHEADEAPQPTQTEYLRLMFNRAPEVALNYQSNFYFYADTLMEGEMLQLQFAVTNVELHATDSLEVQYAIINSSNQTNPLQVPPLPPIASGQTINATLNHSTAGLSGNNILAIELNPNQAQLEKFRFNNVVFLPFYVKVDKINPYVDVTFDGRHITDGELVSSKPEITLKLTDENRYLALNDTASFELYLVSPDAGGLPTITQRIFFNHPDIHFTPATDQNAQAGKNSAIIQFTPDLLTDGLYELKLKAKDRSGNNFAASNFSTKFRVINKPMISNLLNYPNPFTSSTRFVFTITGHEIPQFMNIQIMTISGRVVREISAAELGALHIGNNITEFAWDGTDQYGNPLGNGLYLYRFVSRLNGQKTEHYSTGADEHIKNGIGKMYLMR